MKKTFILLLLLFVLIFPLFPVSAQESSIDYSEVYINEIMPNPDGSDTDYEWVELYNDSDAEISLSGCAIDSLEIPNETVIPSQDYLIITKDLLDADQDGQSFEQRWGDGSGVWGDSDQELYSALELNISLKNSDDELIFTCGDYSDSVYWESSESGQSLSRTEDGEWSDKYLITPGQINEEEPEVIYNHSILISEVYPSPNSGEDEWIELFNYSNEYIDLNEWLLEDGTSSYTIENIGIDPQSYLVLDDLSITLNNGGEGILLLDPNEEIVDDFDYDSTLKGLSNIRVWEDDHYSGNITQTQVITPGSVNEYIDPEDLFYNMDRISIKDVRSRDIGEEVCTSGIISVEMNVLGTRIFYIQDRTAGIQIHFKDEEYWEDFVVGDEIKVFGEIKETKGESKIYVSEENALEMLSSGNKLLFNNLATGEGMELQEGRLAVITGEIVKTSGKTFYIDDGSGQIKVVIKSSTGIDTPEKKKGQFAGIVGIVSQYGEEGDNVYRILPRYQSDIVISDEPLTYGQVLAMTGGEIKSAFLASLYICLLITIIWLRQAGKVTMPVSVTSGGQIAVTARRNWPRYRKQQTILNG